MDGSQSGRSVGMERSNNWTVIDIDEISCTVVNGRLRLIITSKVNSFDKYVRSLVNMDDLWSKWTIIWLVQEFDLLSDLRWHDCNKAKI